MEIIFFTVCAAAVLMPLFLAWQSHEYEVALLKDNIAELEAKIARMKKARRKS